MSEISRYYAGCGVLQTPKLKLNSEESECKPIGISKLLCDYEETITLVPENLEREQRNGSEEG